MLIVMVYILAGYFNRQRRVIYGQICHEDNYEECKDFAKSNSSVVVPCTRTLQETVNNSTKYLNRHSLSPCNISAGFILYV